MTVKKAYQLFGVKKYFNNSAGEVTPSCPTDMWMLDIHKYNISGWF